MQKLVPYISTLATQPNATPNDGGGSYPHQAAPLVMPGRTA